MAYFVADEKLQGYYVSDGVTINIVKYHFECDDAASLPAQTAFISSKKVKISMASTAHTIDTDALYKMSSSGAWIQQSQPWKPLADYSVLSNKPQINGHTLTGNQSGDDLGLQNTLTFDNTPTQNSTNPVTSRGVWTDQQRQEAEIGVVANAGAKSLLPIGVSSITYYSAVTFSVADDGQITVDGTNPNTNNGIVYQDIVTAKAQQTATRYTLPVGRYKITGTGTNGLRFQVHCHDGTNTYELHSSSSSGEFNYTESLKSQYPYICWRILIVAKASFSNHVVKPMIWDAAITDPTFQPYAKTNRELTVLLQEMYDMILAL